MTIMNQQSRSRIKTFWYESSLHQIKLIVAITVVLWCLFTIIFYDLVSSYLSVSVHHRQHKIVLNSMIGGQNRDDLTQQQGPQQQQQSINLNDQLSIAVLMIACKRINSIRLSLDQLLKIRDSTLSKFPTLNLPVVVSQDCGSNEVTTMLQNYVHRNKSSIQMHIQYPFWDVPIPGLTKNEQKMSGYFHISRHYKWAIDTTFQKWPHVNMLIIVEDDLGYSSDFFEYFLALAPLLNNDSSLYCVSAWNDNGKANCIDPNAQSLLHRTDFFPGLGWMLKRSLWNELTDKWPRAFWDDWLRNGEQRKNRSCIRPEISRTSTFGKKGVSKGQYYDQHLRFILHSKGYYPFYEKRHHYQWALKEKNFDQTLWNQVYNLSTEIHPIAMKHIASKDNGHNRSYRVTYYSQRDFIQYASIFGLMSDFKYGTPRTAYKGIVSCFYRGYRLYLAPPPTRKIYISEWN